MTTTINKTEALARLTALEAEAAALREILSKPDRKASLLVKPEAKSQGNFWRVFNDGLLGLLAVRRDASVFSDDDLAKSDNVFQSKALASAYAEAFETFLALRHCEGTEAVAHEKTQFTIEPAEARNPSLMVDSWVGLGCKMRRISPMFATREDAQAAIDKLGADRILKMFRTFHHVGL